MKRYILVLGLFIIIFGCKKDEIETQPSKLKNCEPGYLQFSDNMYGILNQSFSYPPDSGKNIFSYEYQNNKIVRVSGGFIPIPGVLGFSKQIFSLMAYDSIVYLANNVSVYQKYDFGSGTLEKLTSPTIFTLNPKNQLLKVARKNAFQPKVDEFFYAYVENQIIETNDNGKIRRKFHFENDNLIKITSQFENTQGEVMSKEEILFQGYDDNPNPFRNLFFISGAFYRAFSKNNYTSYTINQYDFLIDGTFGISDSYWYTLPIRYNADNYPMFGDYQ